MNLQVTKILAQIACHCSSEPLPGMNVSDLETRTREIGKIIEGIIDRDEDECREFLGDPDTIPSLKDILAEGVRVMTKEIEGVSTIDSKTHADVMQLIEDEMYRVCKADCDDTGSADRLASLIEGRLGHETPKKALFPGITHDDWEIGTPLDKESTMSNPQYWIRSKGARWLIAKGINNVADAKLIVKASKIGELLAELLARQGDPSEPTHETSRSLSDICDDAYKVLREAGAEI